MNWVADEKPRLEEREHKAAINDLVLTLLFPEHPSPIFTAPVMQAIMECFDEVEKIHVGWFDKNNRTQPVKSDFTCQTCQGYGVRPEDRGNFCMTFARPCVCRGNGWFVPRRRAGLADPIPPLTIRGTKAHFIIVDEVEPLLGVGLLQDLKDHA